LIGNLSGISCPAVGACTAVGDNGVGGAVIIGQAPTTSVGIPSNGATVSEDTWLDAGASSPVGIASVTFEASGGPNSISDQVVGSGTGTYYGYIGGWDTRDVPNGTYTLQSVATDTTGVSTAGAPITVTVDNPPLSTTVIIPSSGFTLNTAQTYVLDAIASAGATAVSFVVTVPGFITETIPATPTIYGWIAEPGGGCLAPQVRFRRRSKAWPLSPTGRA
jgi:hypothetical protein